MILYVDPHLIVINKPTGMPSHPLTPGEGNTALDWVISQFPEVASASDSAREGGLCHRLDNNTSGCLVFARDGLTHARMREAFSKGEIKREYLALVAGEVKEQLLLNKPIAHHQKNKRKMVVVNKGHHFRGNPQPAETIATPSDFPSPLRGEGRVRVTTLLNVKIQGGRRHQIRVHLADAGYPLIGDILYGGPPPKFLPGHALHAWKIALLEGIQVEAPPPKEFVNEALF